MGLDVYAGTLVRFYSRDWERAVQRFAREQGLNYSEVYTDGIVPDWPDKKQAVEMVSGFRDRLQDQFGGEISDVASWSEEECSYDTDKIDYNGRNSLVFLAAYLNRPELTLPDMLPADLDADQAYSEAVNQKYYTGAMSILECGVFLPSQRTGLFITENPMGVEQVVTTTQSLRWALDWLSDKVWSGDTKPEEWRKRGLTTGGGKVLKQARGLLPWRKKFVEIEEPPVPNTLKHNAEFGFGVLTAMLAFSDQYNVPILMDE